jgi:hypothetical protein
MAIMTATPYSPGCTADPDDPDAAGPVDVVAVRAGGEPDADADDAAAEGLEAVAEVRGARGKRYSPSLPRGREGPEDAMAAMEDGEDIFEEVPLFIVVSGYRRQRRRYEI